ncbi:BURP domain [Sesbania bispinosa]|nr:BURP domain [Sesbania bispinosa]
MLVSCPENKLTPFLLKVTIAKPSSTLLTHRRLSQGEDMKDIIDQCKFEPTKGETKACPISLESMLDFVRSVLGAEASYNILTTSYPTTSACHPRPYPYALYYCHYLDIGSKVFKVLLGGEYGDIMDALGICHLDTSDMNPNHIIFQQLGIKPGEAPLCHFFPVKHLLWVTAPTRDHHVNNGQLVHILVDCVCARSRML